MDKKLFEDRMSKFALTCNQLNFMPEILFARGTVNGRSGLMLLSGPVLSIKDLNEIREVLDMKEASLKKNN